MANTSDPSRPVDLLYSQRLSIYTQANTRQARLFSWLACSLAVRVPPSKPSEYIIKQELHRGTGDTKIHTEELEEIQKSYFCDLLTGERGVILNRTPFLRFSLSAQRC